MFLDYVQVALDRSRLRKIFNLYVKVKYKIKRGRVRLGYIFLIKNWLFLYNIHIHYLLFY